MANMKISKYYQKKYKAHQRQNLFPLYEEHSTYLLRVLKTLKENSLQYNFNFTSFVSKLETFRDVATCHEIAINNYSNLKLATHQNYRGKEAEYTNHPSAKGVGRDLRVRLVWDIIISEIEQDPDLSDYEVYGDLNTLKTICCPFCGEVFAKMVREQIGTHLDGTPNILERWDWDNRVWCDCWIGDNFDISSNYLDEIEELVRLLEDIDLYIYENDEDDLKQSLDFILSEFSSWEDQSFEEYKLIEDLSNLGFSIEYVDTDSDRDDIIVCKEGQDEVVEFLEEVQEAVKFVLKKYNIENDIF